MPTALFILLVDALALALLLWGGRLPFTQLMALKAGCVLLLCLAGVALLRPWRRLGFGGKVSSLVLLAVSAGVVAFALSEGTGPRAAWNRYTAAQARDRDSAGYARWVRTRNYPRFAAPYQGAVDWTSWSAAPRRNMLPDGGFENGEGWTPGGAFFASGQAHGGQAFADIPPGGSMRGAPLRVSPGAMYVVSAWVRLPASPPDLDALAEVVAEWGNDGFHLQLGEPIVDTFTRRVSVFGKALALRPTTASGTGWLLYERVVKAPARANTVTLSLRAVGLRAHFDDVCIEPYSSAQFVGQGSLANPLLVEAGPTPGRTSVTLRLVGMDGPLYGARLEGARVDGRAVAGRGEPLDGDGGLLSVALDLPGLAPGGHVLEIDLACAGGAYTAKGQVMAHEPGGDLLLAVLTDLHYFHSLDERNRVFMEVMEATMDQIRVHGPDAVVVLGDYMESHQPPVHLLRDLDRGGVPYFIGRGNHEYDGMAKAMTDKYFSQGRTFFSTTIGQYHLVFMDGNDMSPDGSHRMTLMSRAQLAWLEDDLRRNAGKCIVVFTEPAVFLTRENGESLEGMDIEQSRGLRRKAQEQGWFTSYSPSEESQAVALRELFTRYGVKTVVQGDLHVSAKARHNGVDYVTVPSPTVPFWQNPWAGYGLVHLRNGQVRFCDSVEMFHPDGDNPSPPLSDSFYRGVLPDYYYTRPGLTLVREGRALHVQGRDLVSGVAAVPVADPDGRLFPDVPTGIDVRGRAVAEIPVADGLRSFTPAGRAGGAVMDCLLRLDGEGAFFDYVTKDGSGTPWLRLAGRSGRGAHAVTLDGRPFATVVPDGDGEILVAGLPTGRHTVGVAPANPAAAQ